MKEDIKREKKHKAQSTQVVIRSMGLDKLPFYNRTVVMRGQQNKEIQSRKEIQDFRMYSL